MVGPTRLWLMNGSESSSRSATASPFSPSAAMDVGSLCPGRDLDILLLHDGQESVHKEVECQTENLARVSS